jgi:hypothetical protein
LGWVQSVIGLFEEREVLAARNAVLRRKPDDVRAAFTRELQRRSRPAPVDVEALAPRPKVLRTFAPDEYGG